MTRENHCTQLREALGSAADGVAGISFSPHVMSYRNMQEGNSKSSEEVLNPTLLPPAFSGPGPSSPLIHCINFLLLL